MSANSLSAARKYFTPENSSRPLTASEVNRPAALNGALPPSAFPDAIHIAVAAAERMDYLLTWNCKHIANGAVRRRIEEIFRSRDLYVPAISTPEELMGEDWKFEDLI